MSSPGSGGGVGGHGHEVGQDSGDAAAGGERTVVLPRAGVAHGAKVSGMRWPPAVASKSYRGGSK